MGRLRSGVWSWGGSIAGQQQNKGEITAVTVQYFLKHYVSSEGRQQWVYHQHCGLKPPPGLNHFSSSYDTCNREYGLLVSFAAGLWLRHCRQICLGPMTSIGPMKAGSKFTKSIILCINSTKLSTFAVIRHTCNTCTHFSEKLVKSLPAHVRLYSKNAPHLIFTGICPRLYGGAYSTPPHP